MFSRDFKTRLFIELGDSQPLCDSGYVEHFLFILLKKKKGSEEILQLGTVVHAYDHSLGKWRQEGQERGHPYIYIDTYTYIHIYMEFKANLCYARPCLKKPEVDREKMMEDDNNEQDLTDVGMEWC